MDYWSPEDSERPPKGTETPPKYTQEPCWSVEGHYFIYSY